MSKRDKTDRRRAAQTAARSLYREFEKAGLESADVVAAATELLACVSENLSSQEETVDASPVSLEKIRTEKKENRGRRKRRNAG